MGQNPKIKKCKTVFFGFPFGFLYDVIRFRYLDFVI